MTTPTTTVPTLAAIIDELVGLLAPDQGEMLTDEGRRLFGLACRAQSLVADPLPQGDLREAIHDWIRSDLGVAAQMTMTPEKVDHLINRLAPSAPPLGTKACKAEVSKNQHKGERL